MTLLLSDLGMGYRAWMILPILLPTYSINLNDEDGDVSRWNDDDDDEGDDEGDDDNDSDDDNDDGDNDDGDNEYDASILPTLEFSPSMIRWGWAWEAGLHSGISCRNTELKE